MNATPLLARVVAALREQGLEAVLIGNAAAAIHGAPVTTLDFDFMFRDTPVNLRKLKRVAAALDAMILRPFYPVSKLYRVVNDDIGLQADFMPVIHGVRSFEGLRDRAAERSIAGTALLVASLDDVIASKEAAGRDRDLAVLSVLKQTRDALSGGAGKPAAARKPRRRGGRSP
ncbi:MAG: nucleotidyltransferase [Planctomycetaceae bacterium]